MNYRDALIFPATDIGEAGTKTLDIDISKPISRIEITFKTTKATQGMSAGSPANIPKIELVDGSTLLHSLSGYQNQALAYYSRPGRVMDHGQHINALSELDTYALDFGRYLWDPELAFDPTRFHNPQLKITWDEDVSDPSVSANELEVLAHIFDEKVITPLGFLLPVEHYSYTPSAADAYETIELPEDRVIRQILVRAHQAAYEPWYNIDEARFDEGTLDRIPWEFTSLERYHRRMKSFYPPIVHQVVVAPLSTGNTYYFPITDYNGAIVLTGMGGAETAYIDAASGRGGKFDLISSSNNNQNGVIIGYLPWHCYLFPMGQKDKIEDWYDPAGKKPRLRLRAGTGGSSVTGEVILEELYKY